MQINWITKSPCSSAGYLSAEALAQAESSGFINIMRQNNIVIIYSKHAIVQMNERGAVKKEVEQAIIKGERIPAKKGRQAYRMNFQYNNLWSGKYYPIKQVIPIVKESGRIFIVVTVYTFYF